MGLVLDLIIVAIVLITALISAKRGFVKVFVEIVGSIFAFLAAFVLSEPISVFIGEKLLAPIISGKIQNAIVTANGKVIDALPRFMVNNASMFGIDTSSLGSVTGNAEEMTEKVMRSTVLPAAEGIIRAILIVALVIILLFVVKLLAKLINKAFSFSIVGKVNKTLGFVFGLLKGVLFAVLFCALLSAVTALTPDGFFIFDKDVLAASCIFNKITSIVTCF